VPQHVIAHAVAVAVAVHIVGPAVRGLCEPRLGEPGLGELGGLAPTCTTIITTGLQDRRAAWALGSVRVGPARRSPRQGVRDRRAASALGSVCVVRYGDHRARADEIGGTGSW